MEIKIKAYAKINLMLDIVTKRLDSYHDLFMIMQSVSVYDTVTVRENKSKTISISSNLNDIPLNENNIAWKAAEAFFKHTKKRNRGLEIDIIKRIPHAAGLAGGSADGAAVIIALNQIYKTNLSDDELCKIGVTVGADVPFCITGGTKLAQGVGEALSNVKPLRKCFIVLAKPDYLVNTGLAFKQFDTNGKVHTPDKLGMLCAVQARNLQQICFKMENVFEQFIEVPGRVSIKEILKNNGALGACMSGSGPTVFGIFTDKEGAKAAAEELAELAKDTMVCTPVNKGCKIVKITE